MANRGYRRMSQVDIAQRLQCANNKRGYAETETKPMYVNATKPGADLGTHLYV